MFGGVFSLLFFRSKAQRTFNIAWFPSLYLSYLSYEKKSWDSYNFMETSRTNAQYKRNDRYNLLYEIE